MKNTINIEPKKNVSVPDHSASKAAKGEMSTVKKVAETASTAQQAEKARKVDSDWSKYPSTDQPCDRGH